MFRKMLAAMAITATLGAGPALADELGELPQAEPWVDEVEAAPEVVTEVDEIDGAQVAGDDVLVTEGDDGQPTLSAFGWLVLVLLLVVLSAPAWLLWAVPATFGVGVVALVRRRRDRRLEREIDALERSATPLSEASRRAFLAELRAVHRSAGHGRRWEPFPYDGESV